jgi:ectoine hydroxylase-related dioxygenase (phytanoyl-CoA dioxygenase family)
MDLKTVYKEKGIIVIPNVFTPEECDEIKRQAYLTKDADIVKAGYPHSPSETSYGSKALIFFPALANDYLNKIRTDERMVKLVREFIGDDVKQINNQVYFREAGTRDQFAWHNDTMFREPHNFKNDVVDDYFQTIIAVDDITEDNGAVEFVEGSHNTYESFTNPHVSNLRKFVRGNLKGTKYVAPKGSVLIWTVTITHGSESNLSAKDRMTYMNGFCRSKSALAYPDYLINGKVVERMNPRMIP